ncbi:MAG: pectate lyase [Bacteroidetes bacterium]|nr:pectate lyase [Bacteroidota bacterium]
MIQYLFISKGYSMRKSNYYLLILLIASFFHINIILYGFGENDLLKESLQSMKKGIEYFHSININGGYVYYYTTDLKEKWGEVSTDDYTIEVQPPGTPAVGFAFLNAFKVTGDNTFLRYAREAGQALIIGQNEYGGWDHRIYFERKLKKTVVSFDDNQTQSAVRFLMALDQEMKDGALHQSVMKALDMMLKTQLEQGGWPHKYPQQGNYHDYATFNDGGINKCVDVMIDAHKFYKQTEFYESVVKAGNYIYISQLPPPQPGWGQQYNEFLQPAWARAFEPPSVCPAVTLNNVNTLMDIYELTGDDEFLLPITDALIWVESVKLTNGKWPRFVELYTNKPMYYNRGRIRVDNFRNLSPERSTGYGYERDLSDLLSKATERFKNISGKENINNSSLMSKPTREELLKQKSELEESVNKIISSQDEKGRWITQNDKYKKAVPNKKWNGEYIIKDRISSAVFNDNISVLCDYIRVCSELEKLD